MVNKMIKKTNNDDLLRIDSCVATVLFAVSELFDVDFLDFRAPLGIFGLGDSTDLILTKHALFAIDIVDYHEQLALATRLVLINFSLKGRFPARGSHAKL